MTREPCIAQCTSITLVQSTLGVGSVNFWPPFTVAWTKGGGGVLTTLLVVKNISVLTGDAVEKQGVGGWGQWAGRGFGSERGATCMPQNDRHVALIFSRATGSECDPSPVHLVQKWGALRGQLG